MAASESGIAGKVNQFNVHDFASVPQVANNKHRLSPLESTAPTGLTDFTHEQGGGTKIAVRIRNARPVPGSGKFFGSVGQPARASGLTAYDGGHQVKNKVVDRNEAPFYLNVNPSRSKNV